MEAVVESAESAKNYAIFRVEKHKNFAAIGNVIAHATRSRQPANADPARAGENKIIRNINLFDYKTMTKLYQKRSDNVLGIEIFCGTSPKFFRDGGNVDEWVEKNMQFLDDKFGRENVLLAALHADETTPHLQALVRPVFDQKLNAKRWLGGPQKMRKLQDEYAVAMGKLGLSRGIKGSKAKHTRVNEYYSAVNSASEITPPVVTEKRLGPISLKKHETAAEFLERNPGLTEKAMAYDLIKKQNKQMQKTATEATQKMSVWKQKFEAENSRLRGIDLAAVMAAWGYEKDNQKSSKNSTVFRTETSKISCSPDGKFYAWFSDKFGAQEAGGFGAISLVKFLENCDFNTAVSLLKSKFSETETTSAAAVEVIRQVTKKVKKIQPKPIQKLDKSDPSKLEKVRDYLSRTRGLPPKLIDNLIKKSDIYANRFGACVFVRRDDQNRPAGVAIRGTGGSGFKQTKGSQEAGYFSVGARLEEARKVVIVESAIDAMSYFALFGCDLDTCILSLNGHNLLESLADYLLKTRKKTVVALDNFELEKTEAARQAGGKAIIKILKKLPNSDVKIPQKKDWNEDLLAVSEKDKLFDQLPPVFGQDFIQNYDQQREEEDGDYSGGYGL